MIDPAFMDMADRARKAQAVVDEMGFGAPKPEEVTTPSDGYDEGQEQVTVTLTKNQIALIVFTLMEQSKSVPVREQIEWSRLAIGLNDLIVEAEDGETESG